MWIHKDIYDAFYDALFVYYINNDVEETEGYNAKGKRYSLESDEWWTINRTENNKTYFLAQRILKGLSSCDWQYYRLKTNYNSKTPDKVKVNGRYQDIDMRYFTNGLVHMGYSLPNECRLDQYHGIYDQIKGQALLHIFLMQPRYADLLELHPELKFFDIAEVALQDRNLAKLDNLKPTLQSQSKKVEISIFDIAQKLSFYNEFIYELTRQFVFARTYPSAANFHHLFLPKNWYGDSIQLNSNYYYIGSETIIFIDRLFVSEPSFNAFAKGTLGCNCELLYVEHIYDDINNGWDRIHHISTPDQYAMTIIPAIHPFKELFKAGVNFIPDFEERLSITKNFLGYRPHAIRIKSVKLSFERYQNEWYISSVYKNDIENLPVNLKRSERNYNNTIELQHSETRLMETITIPHRANDQKQINSLKEQFKALKNLKAKKENGKANNKKSKI